MKSVAVLKWGLCVVLVGICGIGLYWWTKPPWKRFFVSPGETAVVGQYEFISAPPQIRVKAKPVIELRVLPDGTRTFAAKNLPSWWEWVPRGPRVEDAHEISGEWELASEPKGGWNIHFDCSTFDGVKKSYHMNMWLCEGNASLLMVSPVGDPDNNEDVVFKHQ